MRLVVIESPYAGDIEKNLDYARRAMAHSLSLGEAPIASHLLYTQEGILDDSVAEERALGIEAGLLWARHAELTAVYADLGISPGMAEAIKRSVYEGREVDIRHIGARDNGH